MKITMTQKKKEKEKEVTHFSWAVVIRLPHLGTCFNKGDSFRAGGWVVFSSNEYR